MYRQPIIYSTKTLLNKMRNFTLFFFLISLITSCNSSNNNKVGNESEKLLSEIKMKNLSDSIGKSIIKNLYLDSTGMKNSPIVVLAARLFKEEYSTYKSIRLTYKNVSKKSIEAIRFEWYGENSFGEPADMGNPLYLGSGGGFTEEKLKPNSKTASEWNILSRDGKKVLMARAYEVVFNDGTTWKLKK